MALHSALLHLIDTSLATLIVWKLVAYASAALNLFHHPHCQQCSLNQNWGGHLLRSCCVSVWRSLYQKIIWIWLCHFTYTQKNISTENNPIFWQWFIVCVCVCLYFACLFTITFIAVQYSSNISVQSRFWIGNWYKYLSRTCSVRLALNFSHYYQSSVMHIPGVLPSVHARMHWCEA
jgi:hypothetical protein